MSTGTQWVDPFTTRYFDQASARDGLIDPIRSEIDAYFQDLFGGGGVVGSTAPSVTYASSKLTLAAALVGWTGEGDRIVASGSLDGLTSLPFADSGATVYYIGLPSSEGPTGGIAGFDGTPGFEFYEESVGRLLTPDSVADESDGLRFTMTSALDPGERWTVGSSTRPARVWLLTPETGTAEVIYEGDVEESAGVYSIKSTHYFGQNTAAPSTTAADYVVQLLGFYVSTTDLSSDDTVVFLGTVTSGVHDASGATLLPPIPDLQTAFGVQHDPSTGAHTDVTADSVSAEGNGSGQMFLLDDAGGGVEYEMVFVPHATFQKPVHSSTANAGNVSAVWRKQAAGRSLIFLYPVSGAAAPTEEATTWDVQLPFPRSGKAAGGRYQLNSLAVRAAIIGTGYTTKDRLTVRVVRRTWSGTSWGSEVEIFTVDGTTAGGDWQDGGIANTVIDYEAEDDTSYGSSGSPTPHAVETDDGSGNPIVYFLQVEWEPGDTYSLDPSTDNEVPGRVLVDFISLKMTRFTAED